MADGDGPEPDGWELFRLIEDARERGREELREINARMVSRERLETELERITGQISDVTDRVKTIEAQKQDSRNFRRTVYIALITVSATVIVSIVLAVLHHLNGA